MKQLNDDNFKVEVEGSDLYLVMFSAPWAGPCNTVRPAFEEAASRYGNQINFGEFNLDDNPVTPEACGVKQVPVFYLMQHGVPTVIKAGAVPADVLVSLCEGALND